MKPYLKLLREQKHPARFVASRILVLTGLCRFLTIKQDGYKLRFHPANLPSQLWVDPTSRITALSFFRDYLQPGDRVVDVGANIGDTVITAALSVGSGGHVIGIEAHPRTFVFLKENLSLNRISNVTAINSAVGNLSGTVRFSDDRRDDMNRVDGGVLEVKCDKLDRLIADGFPVNLLKVDVEGYEKFVLEGARELLKRTECVFFEVCPAHFARFNYNIKDLLEFLALAGFRLYRALEVERALECISLDYNSGTFENLVAIRDTDIFTRRSKWIIR